MATHRGMRSLKSSVIIVKKYDHYQYEYKRELADEENNTNFIENYDASSAPVFLVCNVVETSESMVLGLRF